jgi:hypothetical protein
MVMKPALSLISPSSELTHRYPNGECINTSCVHPTFARTALTNDWTRRIDKQRLLEPEEVAGPVVEQVLNGRSGQIYCPSWMSVSTGVRGWPLWLAEGLRARVEKQVGLGR